MREFWTGDQDKIMRTISRLIESKAPLQLYQKGLPAYTVYAREIIKKKKDTLLLLFKPGTSKISQETCFISFQPKGQPLYGFEGVPLIESKQHIVMLFPREIYRVQRRKYTRVSTPGKSKAVFTFKNKHRLHNCKVKDFSIHGARLTGEVYGDVKKGDVIEPISLSLCSRYSDSEERINLPEATVTRVIEKNDETELGILFKIPQTNLDLTDIVEVYIQMRKIEDDSF